MPVVEEKVFENHPIGLFDAIIGLIEEGEVLEHGPTYRVPFTTPEGEITGLTSQTYSEKSKLGKLTMAALQKPWDCCPKPLDTDCLKGLPIRIWVKMNEKGYSQVDDFSPSGNDPFVDQ